LLCLANIPVNSWRIRRVYVLLARILALNDSIGRIAQLKRDDLPFGIRLYDGREFSVESGGSVGIEISARGNGSIIVFNAIENREYRFPVAAIARISTPENLDDKCTWTKTTAVHS
jgi:hypothetical protein